MASIKNVGKAFADRIAQLGYETYSHFLKDFKKKAPVTLSRATLSTYVHGGKPSLERFHALADFLGFSQREKQKMEDAYGGLRSHEPYHPSPDQSKRVGTRYNRKKKAERISLPKNGKAKKQRKSKKSSSASGRVRASKELLLYTKFVGSYKELMKKAPSKRAKVLLFELALK